MGLWYLLSKPFGFINFGANWVVFRGDLKLATGVLILGSLGKGSSASQGQPLPVSILEPRARNYKLI